MPIEWSDDALRIIGGEPRETLPVDPTKLRDLPPGEYTLMVYPDSSGNAAVSTSLPSWHAEGKLFVVLNKITNPL
jgi:hypothetical protein